MTLVRLALALVIVGGINWLLIGLAEFNLVAAIFGAGSIVSRIIYVLVGISALACLKLFADPAISRRRPQASARVA